MTALKNIIDTWNIIEEYEINEYEIVDDLTIAIPDSEYEKLLETVKNKKYIRNLHRLSEWLIAHGYH